MSSGARFRPPIIVSSGSSLLIRFYANGGTGLGYKAFYSFVIGHTYDKSVQPITDCGGYVKNLGGTITMMNMVDRGVKIYDCVWLIRPPKNFLHMKTHMYLKVVSFAGMGTLQNKLNILLKYLTIRQLHFYKCPVEILENEQNRRNRQKMIEIKYKTFFVFPSIFIN